MKLMRKSTSVEKIFQVAISLWINAKRFSRKVYRKSFSHHVLLFQIKFFREPVLSNTFVPLFSCATDFKIEDIIGTADNILNGNYSFLGIKIENEVIPDWHKDYLSGFDWPHISQSKIRQITPQNVDLKNPWELSSFFHLFPVAVAFAQTQKQKYKSYIENQIVDWDKSNTCSIGVNWSNPMVVAIRVVLLIEILCLLSSDNYKSERNVAYTRIIWEHFLFLINNFENLGVCPGNHYLMNIVGVFWASMYFSSESRLVRRYRRWSLKNLSSETLRQTHSDGMNFEGSTCYHRLVTEIVLFSIILADKNDINTSDEILSKLDSMLSTLDLLKLPNGLLPIIGDNDDCRLFLGSDYFNWQKRDPGYLLNIGARFFQRPELIVVRTSSEELSLCIWGCNKIEPASLKPKRSVKSVSPTFGSSGMYISQQQGNYLLVNCNHPGHPKCGHSHNDSLSFVLCLDGTELFVDPGSYVYTRDLENRNYFRSTRSHNTLMVNQQEQWDFNPLLPFVLPKKVAPKALKWHQDRNKDIFIGEHYGYLRLSECLVHRREFLNNKSKNVLLIKDWLFTASEVLTTNAFKVEIFLHLSLDVEVSDKSNDYVEISKKKGLTPLARVKWIVDGDPLRVQVLDGWVSSGYGTKEKGEIIVFETTARAPFRSEMNITKM